MKFGSGQSVKRTEDKRFVSGQACYVDDINLKSQHIGFFLRSTTANGHVKSIKTEQALSIEGVKAIFTGRDCQEDALPDVPCFSNPNFDGTERIFKGRVILAHDKISFAGQAVALIVAETKEAAEQAAELIDIEYHDEPPTIDIEDAYKQDNICFDWSEGDEAIVDRYLSKADHVTTIELINNRVIAHPLETRGGIADYSADDELLTLYTSCQGSHHIRDTLAEHIFNCDKDKIRVVTKDVGGGFGSKIFLYPEIVAICWASKKLHLPIKWIASRSEAFLSDTHGRDHVTKASIAVTKEGIFEAIKVKTLANMGGELSNFAPSIPSEAAHGMQTGGYQFKESYNQVVGVYTNTAPVDAYRGAGRPEASYLIERLVDMVAFDMKLSPKDLREKNFIQPEQMPYTTCRGRVFDSGDFPAVFSKTCQTADWEGFKERALKSQSKGYLRGIGISYYVECCGGGGGEKSTLKIMPDHSLLVKIGTQSNGQGHETAYAQTLVDTLSIDFKAIHIFQGDTDKIETGGGTDGSRSIPIGCPSLENASQNLIQLAKEQLSKEWDVQKEDILFEKGYFSVESKNYFKPLLEMVTLEAEGFYKPPQGTYPNGCHICEVEIDPETGKCHIVNYKITDDFGKIINPLLAAGQVQGGTIQGIGQALYEQAIYDSEMGQLFTGSFMDYAMPRIDQAPFMDIQWHETLCKTNPLGIKGCGEAGAIAAPAAVINAILNACQVRHLDMPVTSEKIWKVING